MKEDIKWRHYYGDVNGQDQIYHAIKQHYFWQVLFLLQVLPSYYFMGVWKKARHRFYPDET